VPAPAPTPAAPMQSPEEVSHAAGNTFPALIAIWMACVLVGVTRNV
jgi:hypothetical protein